MGSKKWIIIKGSREYTGGPGYCGPSCDRVGIPEGKIYDDKAEAEADADKLSRYNPVGFDVEEYRPFRGGTMSLRKELIKLANENPELREHLVPILKTGFAGLEGYEELFDNITAIETILIGLRKQAEASEERGVEIDPNSFRRINKTLSDTSGTIYDTARVFDKIRWKV